MEARARDIRKERSEGSKPRVKVAWKRALRKACWWGVRRGRGGVFGAEGREGGREGGDMGGVDGEDWEEGGVDGEVGSICLGSMVVVEDVESGERGYCGGKDGTAVRRWDSRSWRSFS